MAINYGKGKNDLDYDLEKTRVRIQSSSLQSAGMGGSDAHLSFFAQLPHLGPSGGDFMASRRNCM